MNSHYINHSKPVSVSRAHTQNTSIPLKMERMLAAQNSRSIIRNPYPTVSITGQFRSLFSRKFNKQEESGEMFRFKDFNLDSLGYSRAF